MQGRSPTHVVEVFADVLCPFTHVGLRRFVARRAEAGRDDIMLWVRAWPLEIVNGRPLDAGFVAGEVYDLRAQVAPDLFRAFTPAAFPSTALPALTLAAAAYRTSPKLGERVSLHVRDALFEEGRNIAEQSVIDDLAAEHGVEVLDTDLQRVFADRRDGARRGVIGSPHFFARHGDWFCPSLDVRRDEQGHLIVQPDLRELDAFTTTCFA